MQQFIAYCDSEQFNNSAQRKEVLESLVLPQSSESICKLRMNFHIVLEEMDALLESAEERLDQATHSRGCEFFCGYISRFS